MKPKLCYWIVLQTFQHNSNSIWLTDVVAALLINKTDANICNVYSWKEQTNIYYDIVWKYYVRMCVCSILTFPRQLPINVVSAMVIRSKQHCIRLLNWLNFQLGDSFENNINRHDPPDWKHVRIMTCIHSGWSCRVILLMEYGMYGLQWSPLYA